MKGHYFQLHRERVVQILKSQFPCEASSVKYIGFMSGEQEVEPYTNSELEFLQEANFYWISGRDKPSSCIFIARTFNGRPNRLINPSASW